MSDSEDDFMSDKFLVESASTAASKTRTQQRSLAQLKNQRAGQTKNIPKLATLEKERRAEGLSRSLFDTAPKNGESSAGAGGAGLSEGGTKAMALMQKMGWKVGEGLGKTREKEKSRSPSPERASKRARADEGDEDEPPRRGIGASASTSKPRIEPIRVSLWAGRKGISARSPSPPPLPMSSGRNIDHLDPAKLARLGKETDNFRQFQQRQFGSKDLERKAYKARGILVGYDQDKGVKFHALHVIPFDPLSTLPRPLLQRIYPAQALALSSSPPTSPRPSRDSTRQRVRSPSPPPLLATRDRPLSAAEKVREQMRLDMLSDLQAEGDEDPILARKRELGLLGPGIGEKAEVKAEERDWAGVNWDKEVSGTKKVLSMDTDTYFTFLLSQLRHEHLFCFWCGSKYGSYDEMEGSGGCPGPEEDDH